VLFKTGQVPQPTAAEASGYLFYVHWHAEKCTWYAQISLCEVRVTTRYHTYPWQAAAELEWQLARWCRHFDMPRSDYPSNAAWLLELDILTAEGVLPEPVEVEPWEWSRWDSVDMAGEQGECNGLGAPSYA
jgi:hypothetical protein